MCQILPQPKRYTARFSLIYIGAGSERLIAHHCPGDERQQKKDGLEAKRCVQKSAATSRSIYIYILHSNKERGKCEGALDSKEASERERVGGSRCLVFPSAGGGACIRTRRIRPHSHSNNKAASIARPTRREDTQTGCAPTAVSYGNNKLGISYYMQPRTLTRRHCTDFIYTDAYTRQPRQKIVRNNN